MKELDKISGFCLRPILLKRGGEEKEYGPTFSYFYRPPHDKWWKIEDNYDTIRGYYWGQEFEGKWQWGYKCIICGKFFKLFDHTAKQKYQCFGEAFGAVSGMNAMRQLRIKIHSKLGNNAFIPALQKAGIRIRPASTIKEEMVQHARKHSVIIEQRYREWIVAEFTRHINRAIKEWYKKEDFIVYPMEVPKVNCIKSGDAVIFKKCWRGFTVIFKGDFKVKERQSTFTSYCYIPLKNKTAKVKLSRSGKALIVTLKGDG